MPTKYYDRFITGPASNEVRHCRVCGTRCEVVVYNHGPTGYAAAMAGHATYHDAHTCPHTEAEWHKRALKRLYNRKRLPTQGRSSSKPAPSLNLRSSILASAQVSQTLNSIPRMRQMKPSGFCGRWRYPTPTQPLTGHTTEAEELRFYLLERREASSSRIRTASS